MSGEGGNKMNRKSYKDIYVYIEQRDCKIQSVSIELVGEAKRLAEDLECRVIGVLIGNNVKDISKEVIDWGADEVIVVEGEVFENYTTESYAKALTEVIIERNPEIVLVGATSIGRDLAPRVSARIHTGLTADCTELRIDTETKNLLMTRPAFGGNILATILCETHRPQMATVRAGVMERWTKDETREGIVTERGVTVTEEDLAFEILEVVKSVKSQVDITKADIIVSGGRGVGSSKNFDFIQEAAKALGGQVAGSRAAIDEGWLPKHLQVGQTGVTVRPKLYIACGISGAIQHIAGMEGAEFIIAINKDPEAEIFKHADLGIVGDLKRVLPELIKELSSINKPMVTLSS